MGSGPYLSMISLKWKPAPPSKTSTIATACKALARTWMIPSASSCSVAIRHQESSIEMIERSTYTCYYDAVVTSIHLR